MRRGRKTAGYVTLQAPAANVAEDIVAGVSDYDDILCTDRLSRRQW